MPIINEIKAIKSRAVDDKLKPINIEDFNAAIQRILAEPDDLSISSAQINQIKIGFQNPGISQLRYLFL